MRHLIGGCVNTVVGDIWATNIMIDRDRTGARLVGYLDPRGQYCHTEFELAYLEIWSTISHPRTGRAGVSPAGPASRAASAAGGGRNFSVKPS